MYTPWGTKGSHRPKQGIRRTTVPWEVLGLQDPAGDLGHTVNRGYSSPNHLSVTPRPEVLDTRSHADQTRVPSISSQGSGIKSEAEGPFIAGLGMTTQIGKRTSSQDQEKPPPADAIANEPGNKSSGRRRRAAPQLCRSPPTCSPRGSSPHRSSPPLSAETQRARLSRPAVGHAPVSPEPISGHPLVGAWPMYSTLRTI